MAGIRCQRGKTLEAPSVTGRSSCGCLLPTGTCARCPGCLAAASLRGSARRCRPARVVATPASSLGFWQGTLEKIHFQGLLGQQPLEPPVFPPVGSRARARPRGLFSWLNRFELPAPLVQALPGHPQLLRQRRHVGAVSHLFNCHPLKFPGVSFPLPWASFSGNCVQFCVSLQGFTPYRFSSDRTCARKSPPDGLVSPPGPPCRIASSQPRSTPQKIASISRQISFLQDWIVPETNPRGSENGSRSINPQWPTPHDNMF